MGESQPAPLHIVYSTVPRYFVQDDPSFDGTSYAADSTTSSFGLIGRPYGSDPEFDPEHKKSQWQRFEYEVSKLNRGSGPRSQYKVLYMGRHGQGYHNVAESFYGTEAWDCYWSHLDGATLGDNTYVNFADARLTPLGIAQARQIHDTWHNLILAQKIPTPEIYFTSPMTRCLETANSTFGDLQLPEGASPYIPLVKELFREVIGEHTCDRRSTKTAIKESFPNAVFEEGFVENDELYKADFRETNAAIDKRIKIVLDDVFRGQAKDKTWLSITAHSGAIASILRVIGHQPVLLGTGQVIPVLVKAEWVDGKAPDVGETPWAPAKKCDVPPPPPLIAVSGP